MNALNVAVLQMAPEFTNSVLISRGNDCVIFDAWGTADDWDQVLQDSDLTLHAIYSTHGHYDHISAAAILAERHSVPWYLNHSDLFLIPWCNAALTGMGLPQIPDDYDMPIDLKTGELEILPGLFADVIETPGHSAGGVAFCFPDLNLLIIGDTLFQDTVGRYDLPGSDATALQHSIMKIYDLNLPDNTVVIHGHGPDSTIASLKQNNPYFNGSDDSDDADHPSHRCCCSGKSDEQKCCGGTGCSCQSPQSDKPDGCCGGGHCGCNEC